MARKGSLKKKPKNVAETTAEGQEGQKVSFEVGGKKGSRQENQAHTPGHVLDLAFLVRVNAFWKGWQHQLTTVLVGGQGGWQGLALLPSGAVTSHPSQTIRMGLANGVQPRC